MHDRWAIPLYVRVLQFSQNATMDDVPGRTSGPSSTHRLRPAAERWRDARRRRRRSIETA